MSLYCLAGVLLGLGVGGAESVINAATSFLFPDTTSSAFAARLTADCMGMILGYLIEPIAGHSLPRHVGLISVCLALNAVAVVGYLVWGGRRRQEATATAAAVVRDRETAATLPTSSLVSPVAIPTALLPDLTATPYADMVHAPGFFFWNRLLPFLGDVADRESLRMQCKTLAKNLRLAVAPAAQRLT